MATNDPFAIGNTGPTTDPAALAEIAKSNSDRGLTPAAAPVDPNAASIAKYGTPLPPNDPASLNGGRANSGDLYIGPTNFSEIQKKYTPYQIERATQRDANGNISWRKDVDINSVPRSGAGTALTTPTVGTPAATDVMSGSGPSTTSLTSTGNESDLSMSMSANAKQYLTGIDLALDNITKQQQAITEREKATAEAGRGGAIDKIKSFFDSTSNQDALAAAREKYQVNQNFETLQDIRTKIATATNALEQGLIYEGDRPVRMAAMQGRTATLQKQGQATIGSLKMAAEIVQGNLTFAKMYADDTIAALKQDNLDQLNAADTLLGLYNDDLIRLDEKETDQLNYRKKLLEDENARLDKNKDAVLSLAEQYPQSFTKAGVTFLDTPEEAMQKMLPLLSERERMELEQQQLSLEGARLSNTKKSSGGSGGGSGSATESTDSITGDITTDELLRAAFSEGIALNKVLKDLSADGITLSAKALNAAQDYWSTNPKDEKVETYSVSELNGFFEELGVSSLDYLYLQNKPKEEVNATLAYLRANKTKEKNESVNPGRFFKGDMSTGGREAPPIMSSIK
jgi:hypothetical protein